MSNSVKELVNAFNLNNYAIDSVNTNFAVEDKKKKIVGLFASGTNVEEYLREAGEEIIKLHYRTREAASEYYNLRCFPFVLGNNADKRYLDKGVMEVELADSTNNEVIRNLKLHFVNEFERVIGFKVIASLREEGVTEEEARKWAEGTIQVGAISRSLPYLCCIAFSDEYFKREEYDSEVFELFKGVYIQEFNSRLRKCGLKSSDFYEYKNGMLYIKDVSDKVVKNVTEYVKKEIAFDFRTPGSVESKVENCKNILNDLIFKFTGKLIYGYDYDVFTDAKKIKYGNNFALIPFIEVNGKLQSLSKKDADKINSKLGAVMSDIRGKTADPQFTNCKEPVYGISNKRISQLLPRIMESPIAYNKELGRFEFAVNLEKFRNRQRSFSPNPGSDGEDSPSSSLKSPNKIDSPRQGFPLLSLGSVEAKEKVLWNFIRYLPLEKNEESREKIFPFLSSTEKIEKLYSILSSFCDRDGLYSELHLSREQRNEMEERWRSLHQFEESLSASSEGLKGLTLGGPRCRNSVASKDSAYYTGSSTSLRFSVSSVESSDEDDFSRNSLPYASSISKSSTESFVSSSASVDTVIEVEEDSSSELSESSSSQRASSEPPEKKSGRFSFTHDPGLPNGDIYDENMSGPSAKLSQMELESPQSDQGKELKRVPRQESEEGGLQYCLVDLAGTSSEYQLPTQLSFTKVSGSQSQQSVGAVYNVQARTNTRPQQMNPWLQQGNVQLANPWSQSPWLPQGTHENKWPQGGHSSRTSAWPQPTDPWSSPAPSSDIPGFWSPAQVDSRDKPLTEKEKELIKALLYAFNLNNYILECPNTNFIVENGKIASSINDGVNVKEYLQELRDYTIKYCGTEEKAKEGYDLNEFPFKFLSNCEKSQETTVVANISRGALLNLKKLFIQHEQGVEIEDIDIKTVEKAVEFQKNSWVDSQVKGGHCSPRIATENCYPDESELKHIPIIKDKGGYCLDRTYDVWEVRSFMKERRHAKGTSKAEKMKPEDNKDSGYSSSGFVTDAEKGKKSPKRKSQSPAGRGSPEKSPRIDESDICPANPWAVPGTATFVPVSVSHIKSNIDKLGEDFLRTMKVAKEEKFGSSESEYGHQWQDKARRGRFTKQATEEESVSNWVWR